MANNIEFSTEQMIKKSTKPDTKEKTRINKNKTWANFIY